MKYWHTIFCFKKIGSIQKYITDSIFKNNFDLMYGIFDNIINRDRVSIKEILKDVKIK